MYAFRMEQEWPEEELPRLMGDLVLQLPIEDINIICQETFGTPWPYSYISLPKDSEILFDALKFLAEDQGFFTLSCKDSALIIPFEGAQFNLIVPDRTPLRVPPGLRCSDATDVLVLYRDAYEGFGLADTFTNWEDQP